MFGLRDAEIVALVASSSGFRAAAARLGLAPSAVSARVAQVERALGVQLFDRSRQGARLTPEGRRFVEQSTRLVSLRDAIASDIAKNQGLGGVLRIGVSETIVHTRLPELLRRLAEHAPRVRLELSVDTSEMLNRALIENAIDVAILMRQWTPRDAIASQIETVEIDWFAAPSLTGQGETDEPAALDLHKAAEMAIVTFSKDTPPAREVARIFADPELAQPIIHGSSTLATILRLACDGLGVATLPLPLATAELEAGRLIQVDLGASARLSPLVFDLCYLSSSIAPFAEILRAGAR